jgi:hypothetical protein
VTDDSSPHPRRFARALELALVSYSALLAARPFDEGDTFFHLSLGRAVLRAGARVVPEPTAFHAFDHPAVASEWLWSVLSYATYGAGGFRALSWLGIVLSALATLSALRLVRSRAAPELADGWFTGLCGVLLTCVLQCRVSVRPELCLLIGLPLYLRGLAAYARAGLPARARLGAALVLGAVLWAQLHGSFVLAPALFVICAVDLRAPLRRHQLRCDGVVFALLLLATLSSAYGADVGEFISAHAAGDAPRYIGEMARPTWAMLNPLHAVNMAALLTLLMIAAAGMLVGRALFARELLLALLGLALFATANRFIAEAALLAIPLCMRATAALTEHFADLRMFGLRATTAFAATWALALTMGKVEETHGPIGRLGVSEATFPMHAPNALAGLPPMAAVLTAYDASAPIGFLSDGRLRSFVDGRTPLYFDDTDYAVQREMLRDGAALQRGIARYGAIAAVVRRESQACAELSKDWSVALIEPRFSTFVAQPGASISALHACGVRYLDAASCANPGLAREIARVDDAGARAFAAFLRDAAAVSCKADGHAWQHLLTLEAGARPYQVGFERVLAEALLRAGRWDDATARMLHALDGGDLGMVGLLQNPAAGSLPLSHARRVLQAYVDIARDDADVGVRAALAEICARAGDQACARFNATRAAVRGRSTSALDWLATHHDDPRVRRDAQRWAEVLRSLPLTAATR